MNQPAAATRSRVSILSAMVIAASCSTAVVAQGQVKLESVKPTVFFARLGDGLVQTGEATVNNLSQEQVKITLESHVPGTGTREISATIPEGTTTVRFCVADTAKPVPVTLILKIDGKQHDRLSLIWQSQRRWRVYFIPITYRELGYTDTIENVLNRYVGFYNDILKFCRETDDCGGETAEHCSDLGYGNEPGRRRPTPSGIHGTRDSSQPEGIRDSDNPHRNRLTGSHSIRGLP